MVASRCAASLKLSKSSPPTFCTMMWPLSPKILLNSSLRKPFITAITVISVKTPSRMPRNEKPARTEMKPSLRRARR